MKVRNVKIKRPKFIFSYLVSAVILLIIFSVVGLFYFMQYIYDYMDKAHKYLLDSRNHKIYTDFTPEGVGLVEAEGAYIQRFIATYQAPDRREAYLAYQKQYREAHKDSDKAKASNAERQRKYRERRKAEAQNTPTED